MLVGDAAHTAHFSIGSGTKMAMEDVMVLAREFRRLGTGRVEEVLAAYQDARWVDVLKVQKAAQTSLEWFENSARYLGQDPATFSFNLMTRSKRITYDNLARRDPELVARVDEAFAEREGGEPGPDGAPRPPIFTPYRVRELELANRIVVSPMCQYSAEDGLVGDWHLVHLGSRAVGGAGLVITEMTNVSAAGPHHPGLRRHVRRRARRRVENASSISSTRTPRPRSGCSWRTPAARAPPISRGRATTSR